jgi:hypothetical protein
MMYTLGILGAVVFGPFSIWATNKIVNWWRYGS